MFFETVHLLINTLFGFFSGLFLLRFLMQKFRVAFGNEIGRFVIAFTDWLVKPLRAAVPGIAGFDWASLIAAWLSTFVGIALAWVISRADYSLNPDSLISLLIISFFQLLTTIIWLFKGALIAFVVLSWVAPQAPVMMMLMSFTRPLLSPISRVIPPISGFDLSPLFALLGLQIADIIVNHLTSETLRLFG